MDYSDIIQGSLQNKPVDVQNAVNVAMGPKIQDMLTTMRQEVSAQLFQSPVPEEPNAQPERDLDTGLHDLLQGIEGTPNGNEV